MYKFVEETEEYYIYENNNKYSKDRYTRELADSLILTLENCKNCTNCRDCMFMDSCSNMDDCFFMEVCTYCSHSSYCRICSFMESCNFCSFSEDITRREYLHLSVNVC